MAAIDLPLGMPRRAAVAGASALTLLGAAAATAAVALAGPTSVGQVSQPRVLPAVGSSATAPVTHGEPAMATASAASAAESAGPQVVPDATPASFSLAELDAGEISPGQFDAFWQAELDRIRTAPCAAPSPGEGVTISVLTLGATPPAHLGEAYTDYAPLLAAARDAKVASCG